MTVTAFVIRPEVCRGGTEGEFRATAPTGHLCRWCWRRCRSRCFLHWPSPRGQASITAERTTDCTPHCLPHHRLRLAKIRAPARRYPATDCHRARDSILPGKSLENPMSNGMAFHPFSRRRRWLPQRPDEGSERKNRMKRGAT